MNVLLLGASGMVGAGVLLECLDAADVNSVLVVGRRPCGVSHPKLRERLLSDLFQISTLAPELRECDVCLYCLGVSSVGMDEASYRRTTYDLTLAIARALRGASARAAFLFVSGAGTDATGRGRVMWARVKGETENALLAAGFPAAYMFRPGFIQPLRGVRSRTPWLRVFYAMAAPLAPLLRRFAPGFATTTSAIGRAMLSVARHGFEKTVLETADINRVASDGRTSSGRSPHAAGM
jgi:uncharacterized protein YbjT (DUF2867 family)